MLWQLLYRTDFDFTLVDVIFSLADILMSVKETVSRATLFHVIIWSIVS